MIAGFAMPRGRRVVVVAIEAAGAGWAPRTCDWREIEFPSQRFADEVGRRCVGNHMRRRYVRLLAPVSAAIALAGC